MPAKPPANWKMAIVTWVALLPLAIALAHMSTAIPVALLTWLVMPALTRLLYRWLYPETRT